ncbi:MAG: lysine--tRNA ligase [Bdellovibrionales bacterium]|nr:lysine--tRNA ligase [Bdellovibrionales bacterium]
MNPLKKEKQHKREQLLQKGVDPYPHSYHKERSTLWIQNKYQSLSVGESSDDIVISAGRVMRKRDMGKAAFFNIQDQEGEFQCYIKKQDFSDKDKNPSHVNEEKDMPAAESASKVKVDSNVNKVNVETLHSWDIWKLTDIGDIVGIEGQPFRTKKGELSLRVKKLQMLCKTLEPLPEKYHGLEGKELKYRFRHWDLVMDLKSREIFKIRSKIIKEIRTFMDNKGFLEMETPVLQSIYGGAMAVPFKTHHRRLDREMYLKISPEIYLKKLIVGGFEKIYEIGKNFRNEGIDRTHNPEFTMMEYYEAYTDYNDQMKQFEQLICYVTEKIKGGLKFTYQGKPLDFTPPWKRMTVKEAIKTYSEQNTDVDQMDLKSLFEYVRSLEPEVDLKNIETTLRNDKNVSSPEMEDLKDELILMAFELIAEKKLWNPTFIMDFPLAVSPLTKKHRQWKSIHKAGEDTKYYRTVERFEPYIAGMEIGNAYTELNDPVDQRERLTLQEKQRKEEGSSHPVDQNFLHALEVGMPPTGGVGLGIERLVMILTDQASLRDCILFPMLKEKG